MMCSVCPKCGEPPRYVRAVLVCVIPIIDSRIVYEQAKIATTSAQQSFCGEVQCGGGHIWRVIVDTQDDEVVSIRRDEDDSKGQ